jgi:hypothetical protein
MTATASTRQGEIRQDAEARLRELKAVRAALWASRDDPEVLSELVVIQSQVLAAEDALRRTSNYYVSLMAEGFDEAEAYALTIAYQGVILRVDHGPE